MLGMVGIGRVDGASVAVGVATEPADCVAAKLADDVVWLAPELEGVEDGVTELQAALETASNATRMGPPNVVMASRRMAN
jgi:hypothetical protein